MSEASQPNPFAALNANERDRLHFAALLYATNLGILPRKELIAAADARVSEADKPEAWLIELSSQGESSELNQLAQREFKPVSTDVLRRAYRTWCERKITDAQFHHCCKALLQEGAALREGLSWYSDVVDVDDAFDLAASGVLDSREARRSARVTLERFFQGLAQDWADSAGLLELHTFAGATGQHESIILFLDFPVPKRAEFSDWWKRRGPAIVQQPNGNRIKAVVHFEVGLLQLKGIDHLKKMKPEDWWVLIALLPDVASAEAPVGSKLLVTPDLWSLILG